MSEEKDRLLARIRESKSELVKALVTGKKERIKKVRRLYLKSRQCAAATLLFELLTIRHV